jgi:hypothetical protein
MPQSRMDGNCLVYASIRIVVCFSSLLWFVACDPKEKQLWARHEHPPKEPAHI